MAIRKIKFENAGLVKEGEIKFGASHIAAILGTNGVGKSVLGRSLAGKKNVLDNSKTELRCFYSMSSVNADKLDGIMSKYKFISKISKKISDISHDSSFDNNDQFGDIWVMFIEELKMKVKSMEDVMDISCDIDFEDFDAPQDSLELINALRQVPNDMRAYMDRAIIPLCREFYDIYNLHLSDYKISYVSNETNPLFTFSLRLDVNNSGLAAASLYNAGAQLLSLIRLCGVKAADFLNIIEDRKVNQDRLDIINNKITTVVSSLLGQPQLSLTLTSGGVSYNNTVSFTLNIFNNLNGTTKKVAFTQLSTGTASFLRVILLMGNSSSDNHVTIIDEPETGMHPTLQLAFREYLERNVLKYGFRFIILTHSPYMLKHTGNRENIYIAYWDDNEVKFINNTNYCKLKRRKDYQVMETIGFLPKYNLMKVPSKLAILVEGASDEIYINHLFDLFGINRNEYCAINSDGSGNLVAQAISMNKSSMNVQYKNIALLPDLDVKDTKKELEKIEEFCKSESVKVSYLGTDKRKTVEGMFVGSDADYTAHKNNRKTTKAIRFSREINKLSQLNENTISNFVKTFNEIGIAIKKDQS